MILEKIYNFVFGSNEYYSNENNNKNSNENKCKDILGIKEDSSENVGNKVENLVTGTLDSMLFDPDVRTTLLAENIVENGIESIAKKFGTKMAARSVKLLTGVFGALTSLGDVLDVIDYLSGQNSNVFVNQDTIRKFYDSTISSYDEIYTDEFKNCLRDYLKDTFKQKNSKLTDEQANNLADIETNKFISLIKIAKNPPPDINISLEKCLITREAKYIGTDNVEKTVTSERKPVNYIDLGTNPQCHSKYRKYYDEYVRDNMSNYGEYLLYQQKLSDILAKQEEELFKKSQSE
jgi:hypothetical protein